MFARVYRMLDSEKARAALCGKARNLAHGVSNYARPSGAFGADRAGLISKHRFDDVSNHENRTEALLHERILIKQSSAEVQRACLRDDKSFPIFLVDGDHDYRQIKKHPPGQEGKGITMAPLQRRAGQPGA